MSSGFDKQWILTDKFDAIEYKRGVCEFVGYIIKGGVDDMSNTSKCYSCPCRKCKNATGQHSCPIIFEHLFKSGMDKSYLLWYFHGEHELADQSFVLAGSISPNVATQSVSVSESSIPDPFIHDSRDHVVNSPELPSVPHIHKESKYERMKRLAKRPLYPVSQAPSKHSLMDTLVKLNDLKTEFNLTDGAVEGMIGFLRDVLPVGNTLGPKFHEMKCTLKEAELTCVTYDVCENNCMLFWKEHIKTTHCIKCKLSRYKTIEVSGSLRGGTISRKRKRGTTHTSRFTKVARKVMRYFPIIPRLRRLYSIKWIAEAMTWHDDAKSCDEFMRHPRDSSDWTNANRNWKEFSSDRRSVRLALSTDGFSPYGCFGANYSCWPVILQPLNLPPSLTMKSEFSMLTILIPGPSSPKSSIDVFLQPLIDDLILLWGGVTAWDAALGMKEFTLRAMLLWCIHDFPAYGMLSGCVTQGKVACPICSANTQCTYLHKSRKCCYLCGRMFLSMDHPFRFDTSSFTFNGKEEISVAPRKLVGIEVEGIVSTFKNGVDTPAPFDFDSDDEDTPISTKGFTRRSSLWDLPYWSLNNTRHNLDLMHIEKNVTENLLNTILALKGTKDTKNAREDLKDMHLKRNLHMKPGETKPSKAPFVLSDDDREHFFETLKHLKVPSGFSSNFRNSVKISTKSFHFKSHDYHVIMQHLLPMLLMHAYPAADKRLFKAIQTISVFFNVLCAKVVSRVHLKKAMRALTVALCVLEIYFPPSFFVIMIHLMHHLGDEALASGPPRFRSMWTFEREMKKYKHWARNKRHIEGSIAEGYLLYEASLYAMEYTSTGKGTHKRNREAFFDEVEMENLERHVGKAEMVALNATQFVQVRRWVLQQQPEYEEWRRKYDAAGRDATTSTWKYAPDDFITWLKEEAESTNDLHMMHIANGPNFKVDSYKKFKCNGYTFASRGYDESKIVQNSGVSMQAYNSNDVLTTYYGVIEGIFDLDYNENTIAVFYCDWVCSDDKTAVKVDPLSKLVMVNFSKAIPCDNVNAEPFILASQASQVFYCKDSKLDGWSVVIPSPKRLTKEIDSLDINTTMYHSILKDNDRLCALLNPIDGL